jgi:hypothetical protein
MLNETKKFIRTEVYCLIINDRTEEIVSTYDYRTHKIFDINNISTIVKNKLTYFLIKQKNEKIKENRLSVIDSKNNKIIVFKIKRFV